MEEVYDLHRYTLCIFLYIGRTEFIISIFSSSARVLLYDKDGLLKKKTCITYDKQKTNILSWGDEDFESDNEDDIRIDRFKERLSQVFEKDKDNWSQDDLFLLKAVSDFMRLLIGELVEALDEGTEIKNKLHYVFIIPSEWKEEIKEVFLRPMFVQADLLSKDDHRDRLLFCTDLESICYSIQEPDTNKFYLERGKNTIICRFCPIEESEILIKLDLVSTVNYTFNFTNALIYPKVVRSNSMSLTISNITDGIRAFIDTKLPFAIREEVVQIIMSTPYNTDMNESDRSTYITEPLISYTGEWELDEEQELFMRSISIFDICAKIGNTKFNNVNDLLLNNLVKEYDILMFDDGYSSKLCLDDKLLNWSNYLLEYNRISIHAKNVKQKSCALENYIEYKNITAGTSRYVLDVIRNSDINSKPRTLSVQNSTPSLSIFLNLKPDAIINIDISLESTLLSFSLLNENGVVKETWDHDYFVTDTSLRSLGSFFSFSELTTLNVKYSFIKFAEDYLMDNVPFFTKDKNNILLRFIEFFKHALTSSVDFFFGGIATKIKAILCEDGYTKDFLVSTQQRMYIKAFTLLYMVHIKDIISSNISAIVNSSVTMNIGYAVTIDKLLLSRLFDTEEDLKDIIYASGLIQRDNSFKKLRVIMQGKNLLSLIQQTLELEFPLKCFFVVARFYKNYVQLTLNQVVTEFSSDDDQEVIIIRDKIIFIPNIYESLCFNMWNSIVEDNSLIQLCVLHQEYNDINILEIFSSENRAEFINNFKQYISDNNLNNNLNQLIGDKVILRLSVSCNCKVFLTINDIIELSFCPVLQDITSLLSASLINKEFFGKYWNIQYVFQLIHFNINIRFQDAVIKMLKEITENVMLEQGIDMPHYVIPKVLDRHMQPVCQQRSFLYKEFKVGALNHIYSDNYGFGFINTDVNCFAYKNQRSDTKKFPLDDETVYPLFKKGNKISDCRTDQIFYLTTLRDIHIPGTEIRFFKLKTLDGLSPNGGAFNLKNVFEVIEGGSFYDFKMGFKLGQDLPFVISVVYEADLSSLSLTVKLVGKETGIKHISSHAHPMTLSRF